MLKGQLVWKPNARKDFGAGLVKPSNAVDSALKVFADALISTPVEFRGIGCGTSATVIMFALCRDQGDARLQIPRKARYLKGDKVTVSLPLVLQTADLTRHIIADACVSVPSRGHPCGWMTAGHQT
jgi:hypothetical protein